MDSALILISVMLVAIILLVVGLGVYLLIKYALVFILAGAAGKIIDKIKK